MKKCIIVELPTGLCRMELNEKGSYEVTLPRDIGLIEKYTANQVADISLTASEQYPDWVSVQPYFGNKGGDFKVYIQYDKWPDSH